MDVGAARTIFSFYGAAPGLGSQLNGRIVPAIRFMAEEHQAGQPWYNSTWESSGFMAVPYVVGAGDDGLDCSHTTPQRLKELG